jgi:hypothetical protein
VNEKKLVHVAIVGTGLVVVVDGAASGEFPPASTFIALGAMFFFVSLLADFAPQVGGPLAVLIFLAVLFERGGRVFKSLERWERKNRMKAGSVQGGRK